MEYAEIEAITVERKPTNEKVKDAEFVEEADEEIAIDDLRQAFDLLKKCMHLLDTFADTDLMPTITKRERQAMTRCADMVNTFLTNTEYAYDDDDDED